MYLHFIEMKLQQMKVMISALKLNLTTLNQFRLPVCLIDQYVKTNFRVTFSHSLEAVKV